MKKSKRGPLQKWADEIGWKRRVKAVCKPCWELKYCPYGPLVEKFPLPDEHEESSCRIFGHDCPVFFVAEPMTETKELRNISRHIPRPMQFRVLKRDNQICAGCRRPVVDGDIHFDHIIPWSKGGPTEEHNIRLLCGDCNRKRGTKYEVEYLVDSMRDHVVEPVGCEFMEAILEMVGDAHVWQSRHSRAPDLKDVCRMLGMRKAGAPEQSFFQLLIDLREFFSGAPPAEVKPAIFAALRMSWGYADGVMRKLRKVANSEADLSALVQAEADLIRRLGWPVKKSEAETRRWEGL